MQRIVVDGATSMLGLALIKRALEKNIEILALVNPESSRKERIPHDEHIEVLECSLANLKTVVESYAADKSYDIYYHLAWAATSHTGRNDVRPHIDNISYTIDAVEAAHILGCTRFIGTGSQAEYGRVDGPLTPDTICRPEVPYGAAKLCAGDMSRIRCRQLGMQHIWTRILSAYGPYETENSIISLEIRALLKGEHFPASAGDQIWEFIYSEDVAEALLLLANHGINGRIYPIGSGDARPLREFLEIVKNKIDPTAQIGYGEIPYGPLQVMHLEADILDMVRDTGYKQRVSFTDGIDRTIEYYRNRSK